jgi:hypothetical protein
VLLVSRGDSELLRLGAREARHFPSGPDGGYLGRHPADDEEALELLAAERSEGADYLVIPATEAWWIHHYKGLAARLQADAAAEAYEPCTIYRFAALPAGIEARR